MTQAMMQPTILSRSFWHGKLQSLKSRSKSLRRTSRQTAPPPDSSDLMVQLTEALKVVDPQVTEITSGDAAATEKVASSQVASHQFVSRTVVEQPVVSSLVVTQAAVNKSTYTVQSGDTFASIASKLGLTIDVIQAANPSVSPTSLQVGQVLNLQVSGITYTIQPGDTFNTIAQKFGIAEPDLEKANPTVNVRNLQVGSQITVPISSSSNPAPPQTSPVPTPVVPTPAPGSTYIIQPGDTFNAIAAKYGISVDTLEAANPTLSPLNLHVGSQMVIPAATAPVPAPVPVPVIPAPPTTTSPPAATPGTYIIKPGDTFNLVAQKYNISLDAILAANPNVIPTSLQVGQVINIPTGSVVSPAQPNPVPSNPAPAPAPVQPVQPTPAQTPIVSPPAQSPQTSGTYTVQAGDTLVSIAAKFGTTLILLETANPGIVPNILKIGQVINLPTGSVPAAGPPSSVGGAFVNYSGPASNYPDPSQWAPYAALWAQNAALMSYNDSPSEIALIASSITLVSAESGIDPRVILCIIMQESGGNLRVGNTFNGVNNTGIMQAFDGVSFNPADPAGSILQMIRDGSEGTPRGQGLKQAFAQTRNWYEAARVYNSGSVDKLQLNNALGATGGYVVDFANRLMGHTWPNM